MDSSRRLVSVLAVFLMLIIAYGVLSVDKIPPEYDHIKLSSINYTGLPERVDVKIYPKRHIIHGDSFRIVFENNRNAKLYWGSDWIAEKWVDGEWVNQVFDWAWTAEIRATGPFSRVVNTHSFPFGDGLYRITKKCMLTDVYIRDEGRWESMFSATFYLIKTS